MKSRNHLNRWLSAWSIILIGALYQVKNDTRLESRTQKDIQTHVIFARHDYGAATSNTDIYSLALPSRKLINLTSNLADDDLPVVNKEATRVAFLSNRTGLYEIYIMDIDGNNLVQATSSAQPRHEPVAWSPNNKLIVFSSLHDDQYDLFELNTENNQVSNITMTDTFWEISPAFSPRGDQLAFVRENDLYIMEVSNHEISLVVENVNSSPMWSPSGEYIAFSSFTMNNNADLDLYVVDIETRDIFQLTSLKGDDREPSWSYDNKYIAFVSNIPGNQIGYDIFKVVPDGSESPIKITSTIFNERCPTWTTDDHSILYLSDQDIPFESYDIHMIDLNDNGFTQITKTDGVEKCPLNYIPDFGQ